MAKTRMNDYYRRTLRSYASETVNPKAEAKAFADAYRVAAPLVRKIVQAKFPPRDMRVLRKYECTNQVDEVLLQLTAGGVERFDFKPDDLVEKPDAYAYRRSVYLADQKTTDAIQTWIKARDALKAETERRIAAYKALIANASYLEDVIEVWPDAANAIPNCPLPVVLEAEQLAVIATDIAERKAA